MRVNPFYSNICWCQIGSYRKDPCYDCKKLSECDLHWDENTHDWDYPIISFPGRSATPRKKYKARMTEDIPYKRNRGKRKEILRWLNTHKHLSQFSSKIMSATLNMSPKTIGDFLRNVNGIQYHRSTLKYTFTGEEIKYV